MSLSQDQAQASQAQNILDEQQYQKDLAQYDKDTIQYNKEKAAYDLQVKNIKDAESAEKKRVDDIAIASAKKAADRAAEIKAVHDKYAAQKNPYTYKPGSAGKSYNNDSFINWNTSQAKSQKAELAAITYKNVVADGFKPASINRGGFIPYPSHPTSRKLYTGEAINQHAVKALKSGTTPSNRWTRYQVEITRANQAVYAGGSLSAHASAVQSAKDTFDGAKKQEQLKFSAAARKESVNQQINDAKHWNEVINNPNTSKDLQKTNQDTLEKQGLHIDVKALDASGVSSVYNVLDMSKSGSLPSSASVTINTKKYSISNRPDSIIIPTRTNTSGNSSTNKANIAQKQYANDVRSGKVGLAQALLKPQTPQSYSRNNTINLKQFLVERGYDISKPETIPDSVLTTPVKYDAARKQASYAERTNTTMGDLRGLIPSQPKVSDAILQKRQNALSFNASKENKGGSYIGYGTDGTPVQGAVQQSNETQWVVTDPNKTVPTSIPSMMGKSYTVQTPVTYTFATEKEANTFAKSLTPKIKSDNEFVNSARYSDLVDAGEVQHPRDTPELSDDVLYYSSAGLRPIYNLGLTGYNLATDEQTPIKPTTLESFVGGLLESGQHAITGGQSGRPLQQTMKDTWKHISSDPIRSIVEIPAEVGITLVGGKALQGLGKAGILAKESLKASAKTPTVVKNVIQTGEKIDFKVKMLNPVTKKNYQKTQEIAKDLYSKYPNKSSYNVDVIDSKTFLITAGTEAAPVRTPAMVVKYGTEGVKKTERQSLLYTEYQASVYPIKAVKVQGVMEKNLMEGVEQTGKFEYTIPATPKNMATLSSEKITNVIKPVGYEVAEKTSMLSKSMRHATMSAAEDPTIQKTSLTVLGETQAAKWYVAPRDKIFSKDNDTFYKKNPFTNKKTPEESIPKPVDTILKTKSVTAQSNNVLKNFARKSTVKQVPNYLAQSSVITHGITQRSAYGMDTNVRTDVRSSQELTPATAVKEVTALKQSTSQVSKQVTKVKTQTRLKTQTKLRLRPVLAQKTTAVLKVKTPLPTKNPRKKVPVIIKISEGEKNSNKSGKKRNRKNFLGNSRVDNIVGLFKRDDVIYGDVKVKKQLKKDKKYKEKKNTFGFSSKKGFKI